MNILVLMKRTFDTEEKVQIENNAIVEDGVEFVINPYDEYAIEEAIKLRDEHGGEVTVLTVGPADAEKEIRTALAMGADKAILVEDEDLNADEHTIAHILAAIIKEREFDIILGGNVSVDNGAGQVAVRVAELLDIPQVTTITKLDIDGNTAIAERDVEGDVEIVEVSLPALFTAQQGLNEPRYPSLPGIMKAKKKPLERLTVEDLNLNLDEIGAKTEVLEYFLPPEKKAGRILEGELDEQVKELVQLLRDEAKVV
ncbi:electron transfer flavoprotein subunit beta/FixA family protein [Caldalkalibacillus thermarum TA2.A1]|uniref:Electron transfer flavoprotein subunit beta n=2 Tax=Caldalkalibacillus thermarum (strain TA2.A1) TaxID=986075 RepID=A0A8X8I3A7_CALTT|nr:electron transfer flavoprotein subunit beta/FixA family protein [Caldalkalibacillus thermarum]QZT33621.1 electron transfer flavoprotein subunit beta/FixA family protein [Caldalkalibacillus thermarum TA2.A1]